MTTTYDVLSDRLHPTQALYFDEYFFTEAVTDAQLVKAVRQSTEYGQHHPDVKSEQVSIDDVLADMARKYYLKEDLFARLLNSCEANLAKI